MLVAIGSTKMKNKEADKQDVCGFVPAVTRFVPAVTTALPGEEERKEIPAAAAEPSQFQHEQ
jgi:hypothetical protein